MKKLFIYLFIMLPLLSLISCSNDSNENVDEELGIAGPGTPVEKGVVEPILAFGKSKDYIKSVEKRKLEEENDIVLVYSSNGSVISVSYAFYDGLLGTTTIVYAGLTGKEVLGFFEHKYCYVETIDQTRCYVSSDGLTEISLIDLGNNHWSALYSNLSHLNN